MACRCMFNRLGNRIISRPTSPYLIKSNEEEAEGVSEGGEDGEIGLLEFLKTTKPRSRLERSQTLTGTTSPVSFRSVSPSLSSSYPSALSLSSSSNIYLSSSSHTPPHTTSLKEAMKEWKSTGTGIP